ncbi:MAG: NAD-dependent epimerase/dehydratase family protein [Bryobacteraceae bacterium]
MRIFLTGASGFIGSAVASSLGRAGHRVTGLIRSEQSARDLARNEVEPVIGSMQEPTSWRDAARDCEVLIQCAVEYSADSAKLDTNTVNTLLGIAAESGHPRLFVYTSGCWIYGDTGSGMLDEASAITPPTLTGSRAQNEKLILEADRGSVRTLIVRPGTVYGGRGGLTASWFASASKEGAARIVGSGAFRWSMVHHADLGDLYRRAVESPLRAEILNGTDRGRFTVRECAEAASRAAGAGGKVVSQPVEEAARQLGPMADALTFNQHIDSSKAARLLGWQPRHGGFADGADRYYISWKAHQH